MKRGWRELVVPGPGPACLPPAPGTEDPSPLSTEARALFWLGKRAPGHLLIFAHM